jgi:NADPH:quinone reductase-like Zn-dependent oxidoreductase
LKAGDIVVQSGGETALGKAISQIATASGLTVVSPTSAELEDAEFAKKTAAKGTVKLCITNNSKKSSTKMLFST